VTDENLLPAPPPPVQGPGAVQPTEQPLSSPKLPEPVDGAPPYVYALGRIEARFSSTGVEKEFAQAAGRADTAGQTDRQVFHSVLSDRGNRYLVRQMSWVLTIEGLETYLLVPRDPVDFELLVESVRPTPRTTDVDVVIGLRGSIAPPQAANGLSLPVVMFDEIYSFDVDSLISAIPRPDSVSAEEFTPAAEELFTRLIQIADNSGASDEHRALNYLAVRYPAIYSRAAEAHKNDEALTGVEVRPSRLSGARRIVDVIFSFTHRKTDVVDTYFVRVDVTERFPFLLTKLSPYFRR
jgi:hypothetical protein